MNSYFKNKVVIITGSRMGIGKELAFQLGALGAKLVVNARNADGLEKTTQQLTERGFEVEPVGGNISCAETCKTIVEKTIQRFGKIDILINNAGLTARGSIEESSTDTIAKLAGANLLGPVYMSKYAIPYLRQTKGSILFVGSLAGLNGMPYFSSYSATKMALTAIAQSLKLELKKDNIHVGIAYVGFTENDPSKQIFTPSGQPEIMPARSTWLVIPVSRTAQKIILQIKNRRHKVIHTTIGKLNYILLKFFPSIVEYIISRQAKKY